MLHNKKTVNRCNESRLFLNDNASKIISTILVATVLSFPARAIVPINTEINPKQGVSGNFGFVLSGQSGNKDEQEYSVNALLRFRKADNLFVTLGDFTYSETNDVRDEDELFLHARWVGLNKLGAFLDTELFVQYQYDDFADISGRQLVGGNIRWRNEADTEAMSRQLILGAGLFFENERSELTEISDDTVRANLYARYVYEKKGEYPYSLSMSTYIQPAVNAVSDLRLLALAGVYYPIRPSLTVGFEIEVKHNSDPFVDVEKTDVEYGVSLNYAF